MTAIPALVQRLVFPILVVVGTLLGRYAKYADAPEPVPSSWIWAIPASLARTRGKLSSCRV